MDLSGDQSSSVPAEEKIDNSAPDESDAVKAETEETPSGEVLSDCGETSEHSPPKLSIILLDDGSMHTLFLSDLCE